MRIVAGTVGGRRLRRGPLPGVRPTTDRVREAIFASLESHGAVRGARYCDLFAGTGALGIEALSRGAASVTFVESNRAVSARLRENLIGLGFDPKAGTGSVIGPLPSTGGARLVVGDAMSFLRTAGRFDVVLCDPPYDFDRWMELTSQLDTGLLIAESARPIELAPGLRYDRARRYGDTLVTYAHRSPLG
ncbi:MAG: RsmD family RNA methyltransferase [Acidimicrobiales bacterium]